MTSFSEVIPATVALFAAVLPLLVSSGAQTFGIALAGSQCLVIHGADGSGAIGSGQP
jgi:hypothetical protein